MPQAEHLHEFPLEGPPESYLCACGASLWAVQTVLDAAAEDARKIAGDAYYTGCRIRNESETVELWLSAAPAPVLQELESARPGVFVIHNDAPRSLAAVEELRKQLPTRNELKLEGIVLVGHGPTIDGYLSVGVMSDVPAAQARLDEIFGPGAIRVGYAEPGIAC
jgi:hypothetical protein